jgi:acyl carrier protein
LDNIEQEVYRVVSRIAKTPAERLRPDTDLKGELNVDSLQGLQIVAALEKRFGISIPDEDLDSYTTIKLIVEVIRKEIERGAGAQRAELS